MTNAVSLAQGASNNTTFRNRIINGAMVIDQRNAGASQTLTSGGLYSVDRWQTYAYTANLTGQRVTGSLGFQYAYQITGAASNTQAQFQQKIEAANSYDLAGNTVTLSAYFANTTNTTVNWVAYYANSTDNFSVNTTIASGSWTVTSSLARYSTQISIPSAATTGLLIVFYNTGQTSGTWTITGVQLEAGTTASPFENRSYGVELALCQRYFESTILSVIPSLYSGAYYANRSFVVTKRIAPTSITYTGTWTGTAPSTTYITANGFYWSGSGASAFFSNATVTELVSAEL